MRLSKYIKLQYNNNVTAFAISQGVGTKQVYRWLDMDCIVIDSEVWRRAKPINKKPTA